VILVQFNEVDVARRRFLKTTAATAAGLTIVPSRSVAGTMANSKVELGIIGTGGRGVWIGDLFQKRSACKVVALADVFDDRLDRGRARLKVEKGRCYKGLDAYLDLAASKLDAVAVMSPPYFHPEQTAAAVDAGRHVYLAKPIAVDVPGCRTVVDAARRGAGKTSVFVDFQTRSTASFQEAARRVHQGAIGQPVLGQVFYHGGRLRPQADPADTRDAARLRNWVFDKVLSGDIIVEQNVHVIDLANWYLQAPPVRAVGSGGRKARTDVGDGWDHFVVTYTYPDDVLVDFSSSQFVEGFGDMCVRLFGTTGTVDSHYAGRVVITGQKSWTGADDKVGKHDGQRVKKANRNMFTDGAADNVKTFINAVRAGEVLDNTEASAESTLACILGRSAAYAKQPVTWDEMIRANDKLEADIVV
jgi:predicted dehydrogenase